jgi:type IV pilus assembly protein PilA
MFCYKCGGSMPDSSTVCPLCGAATADAPQPPPRIEPPPGAYNVTPTQAQSYYTPPSTDSFATASLIFGILGLTCFWGIAAIPAVILGHMSRSSIRKSMGHLGGKSMATAGVIMGYVSIAATALFAVAVIVPNLHRTREQEHEHAAQSAMRTLNTSQVVYSTRYPDAGFARDLSTLGPGPGGICSGEGNQSHACLLDSKLGCPATWCDKSGYKYNVTGAECTPQAGCRDYVIVAAPLAGNAANKRYCSTSDAVLRSQAGGPLATPPTVAECQAWSPI